MQKCADQEGLVSCAVDTDCQVDQRCVRSSLNFAGVCSDLCTLGCKDGTSCQTTARGQVCLPDICACHGSRLPEGTPAGTRNLLEEALAAVELTPCDTIYSLSDWMPNPPNIINDPYRLSFFDSIHNEPLRAPDWGKNTVKELDSLVQSTESSAFRAARMVEAMARKLDQPVSRMNPGTIDTAQPLARSVEALITALRGQPNRAALEADAADVPMALQMSLAKVVDGIRRSVLSRQVAVSRRFSSDLFNNGPGFVVPSRTGMALAPAEPVVRDLLLKGINYPLLYGGGVDVLDALAEARLEQFRGMSTQTSSSPANFIFNQVTPVGRIAIGDAESGIYRPDLPNMNGEWALLLDLGGNDSYQIDAGGNASNSNMTSILVDLGGDDRYGYVEVPNAQDGNRLVSDDGGRYRPRAGPDRDNGPISLSNHARQGGARLGTAVLIDMGEGKDSYLSHRMSQGSGIFGTGVLIDEGGDDTYITEAHGQGAGTFGIGLLLDLGGNDVRKAYQMTQGFAYAKGAGLLYDQAGNDQYLMDVGDPDIGGDPLYLSAQRAGKANSSLGQGFAFGRRADFSDFAFMSGGLGMLIDGAGDDRYEASIFAQGGGFWFGTGIFADHQGDDTYDAIWYAMGTGAHYALGLMLEGAGNDVYGGAFPRVNVTIGGAHDYTAAFLIDESGNDVYNGSRITVGSGNLNGMGFMIDNAGDDQYHSNSPFGIGSAGLLNGDEEGNPRRKVFTLGVFLDAGGMDTYTTGAGPTPGSTDNSMWIRTNNMDPAVAATELGTGIDGEGETTLHAR